MPDEDLKNKSVGWGAVLTAVATVMAALIVLAYFTALPEPPDSEIKTAGQTPAEREQPEENSCKPEMLATVPRKEKAAYAARCDERAENRRQATESLRQSAATMELTKYGLLIARKQAWAGFLQVVIGTLTLGAAGLAAFAAYRAAEYSRSAAMEARRSANIAFSSLRLSGSARLRFGEVVLPVEPDKPIKAKLLITNVGSIEAVVDSVHVGIWIGALPQKNPVDNFPAVVDLEGQRISGPGYLWCDFDVAPFEGKTATSILDNTQTLHIVGRVIYRFDSGGTDHTRHALFAFEFRTKTHRFHALDDRDYYWGRVEG